MRLRKVGRSPPVGGSLAGRPSAGRRLAVDGRSASGELALDGCGGQIETWVVRPAAASRQGDGGELVSIGSKERTAAVAETGITGSGRQGAEVVGFCV